MGSQWLQCSHIWLKPGRNILRSLIPTGSQVLKILFSIGQLKLKIILAEFNFEGASVRHRKV